jgi:hypothetical protein
MRKIETAALCFIFSLVSGASSAYAGGIGGCFHGDCDVIWKLNQAFDSGLQSKSESIVGPFKQAYFDVANDLFNNKINPMISDVDNRVAGRLSQAEGIVQEAQQAIDGTLDKAKSLIEETNGDVRQTIQEASQAFDKAMARVEEDIKKIDCVATKALTKGDDIAKDLWGKFIIVEVQTVLDTCNWKNQNIISTPGDALPSYKAAKCILKRKLDASKTVEQVMTYYERLGGVASYYVCVLGEQPAANEARRDLIEYSQAYQAWALTIGSH